MSEKLRAGVIGLGLLGSGYVRFWQDQPEVQVIAVADIRSDKAEELGAQSGAQSYTDYERMLQEHQLDLVAVATPDNLHREPVLAAIKAGVPNIVQEKPMATSVADAEEMLDCAEKSGSRIFCSFANRAQSPLDRATYYVIREGLLGRMVYGEAQVDDHIVVPTQMWGTRSREWAGGSSSAHFLLSHVVDYLRWLMAPAEVKQVYAISQRLVLEYTPDLYDAFLTFENGVKFRVKGAWIKHVDALVEFTMAFYGSEGTITYNKHPGFNQLEGWRANVTDKITSDELIAHQSKLMERGINLKLLLQRPAFQSAWMQAGKDLEQGLEASQLNGDWWRIQRCFIDAIVEGTLTPSSWATYGPLPTGIDGLKQTKIVAAIIESARTGEVVDLT